MLRNELSGPLPSLRSGTASSGLQIFETDRFAITLAPEEEGRRGSVLPRIEPSLPSGGIVRRCSASGEVLEEHAIGENGTFRFETIEPGDRLELQIGEQWIKLPLLTDS